MEEIREALSTHWESPWEMDRWQVINHIIDRYSFERYLEIGVSNPRWCYNMISCREKDGVDPGYEFQPNIANYQMTSDEFFESIPSDKKWDVIFIDGSHVAGQVIKDFFNALNHLSDNGFIILHDCNPPNVWRQRETYMIDGRQWPWNGTVWKMFYYLRMTHTDLSMCCLDTDYGVGIVRRGSQMLAPADNIFYDYNQFDKNRKEYLNLIQPSELDRWLSENEQHLTII